jgi:hypothetical protein
MDHIENGAWRLWVSFVSTCLVAALVLYRVDQDWHEFLLRRREFFRVGDPDIPGGLQFVHSVVCENLTKGLRNRDALKEYFETHLFPSENGQIFVTAVHARDTAKLKAAIATCKSTCIQLEQATFKSLSAEKNNLAKQPTVSIYCSCLTSRKKRLHNVDVLSTNSCLCCSKTVKAMPYLRNILNVQNEKAVELKEEILSDSWPESKMANSGFVTFEKSTQAAADAPQVLLSNDVADIALKTALDPRDVIWKNVTMDDSAIQRRTFFASIFIKIISVFVFIPLLVLCNSFGDIEKMSKLPGLGFLSSLDPDSTLYVFIKTQLPPLLQSLIVEYLPDIFRLVAIHGERVKSQSVAETSIIARCFGFQLVNVYFTLLGSTLAKTLEQLLREPGCAFQLLGIYVSATIRFIPK